MNKNIENFLKAQSYAVAGASQDPAKYGNKVLLALKKSGRKVIPINPSAKEIEGLAAYASIRDLPIAPEALSIITPPQITVKVVADAIEAGVRAIWMQPGAEDSSASQAARDAGISVIDDGSCILVALALEANRARRT